MAAEFQPLAESEDGQVLLSGKLVDAAEIEIMQGIGRFIADGPLAEGQGLVQFALLPGQAVAETGENGGGGLAGGGFLEVQERDQGVVVIKGGQALAHQDGQVGLGHCMSPFSSFGLPPPPGLPATQAGD